ncbi:MAG: AsmA family protein [Verrucomicrobiia bacterium]
MAETDNPTNSGSGPLRKFLKGVAGLLVLLVIAYFVVSSSAFFKGIILPRVGKSLNAEITAEEASLSPFSQVTFQNLKVQPVGAASRTEPLLTAELVKVRYSLLSILRGNYVVKEVSLVSPTIQLVQGPDGRSNLDPLIQEEDPNARTSSNEPLRLALENVSIKNGVLRSVSHGQDGAVTTTELSQLNLSLDRLANGQAGKVNLEGNLRLAHVPPAGAPATNDLAEGKLSGSFDFRLDKDLLPQTLTGNAAMAFTRTEGAYADFAGFGVSVQADMTPSEVRQMALRFERQGEGLGRIQANGPLNLAQSEGRLKIEVQSIDRRVLNLFGATRGWDFRDSTLNATNYVDVAREGEVLGAEGRIAGSRISLAQPSGATPELNVDLDYKLRVNLGEKSAVLERLILTGQQQERPILRASLDRPMTLTWSPDSRGFAESTFNLALTGVELSQWQSLLGTNAMSGRVDLDLTVLAKPDGKELTARGNGRVTGLAAQLGTNRIEQATVALTFGGVLQHFKTITLNQYRFEASQQGQPLLQSDGSGHYDMSRNDLTLQVSADVMLPAFLRQFPTAGLTASKGVVRASSALRFRDRKYTVTGNLSLGDFTGTISDYRYADLQSVLDYNLDIDQPSVQIHSATLNIRRGYTPAGSIAVSGNYALDTGAARLDFKMMEVNEGALAPVLTPALGEGKLVSISLSGNGSAAHIPGAETSIKAGLQVTNWVAAASAGSAASPKLGAGLQVDGSLRQEVLELRQFLLKLTPTQQSGNELLAMGRLDMRATNATPSQLTIHSDSLDLTPYYALLAGAPEAPASPGAPAGTTGPQPAAAAAAKQVEPEPVTLPVQQLTATLGIRQLFLKEVAITNLNLNAQVNRGEVTIKPATMLVNGGLVSGTAVLNLGVPGYAYEMSFMADRVPIEPLSNTFTTNSPGQYTGDLIARAELKGAGTTGPSLQKHLTGNATLNLTNMHYEIVGRKAKRLIEPIALVLRVPELTQTPINWIAAQLQVGNGQIALEQFKVQSQAFFAESSGSIPMAEVLTNSPLNLPVTLSLRRTLAEKANLLPANTPTNAVYAQLPSFVRVTGTLGEPDTEINKAVVGGLLARSISGILPVGESAGNVLQNLGGVLSGQRGATNAPAGTNASASIVQGITGLLDQSNQSGRTNAPATTTTNRPARPNPLQDLLRQIR